MPAISLMIKPASSLCNLSCEYCFYRDVSEHREHLGFGVMQPETTEALVEKAFAYADGAGVSFVFQGGEPTLAGLPYFAHFVRTAEQKNEKRSPVQYALQTNGTTMTPAFARFCKKHGFLVGLSLDGDFDGNRFRKTPDGKNAFHKISGAVSQLKKAGADFNIVTVLTGHTAENGERIYRFFKKQGFRYLQFIPCLRPFGSAEKSDLYMTNAQYADFLVRVFRLYAADLLAGDYISVREFDNWVRMDLGGAPEQCGMAGRCSPQFVAESNGDVYPCDFYCTDEYRLGNILTSDFQTLAQSEPARRFYASFPETPGRCKDCPHFRLCRAGGCRRTRESADYCAAYQAFFSACAPEFAAVRARLTGSLAARG